MGRGSGVALAASLGLFVLALMAAAAGACRGQERGAGGRRQYRPRAARKRRRRAPPSGFPRQDDDPLPGLRADRAGPPQPTRRRSRSRPMPRRQHPPSSTSTKGDEIALIDAIKALITKSANDVAVAVAEHIGGSEESFARLMTQKARQLGMAATIFRNASGLPDDEQVTTARDMMTLALHLQDDFPSTTRSLPRAPSPTTDETLQQPQLAAVPATRAPTASRPATHAPPASIWWPPCGAAQSTWWAWCSAAPRPPRATPPCAPILNMGLVKASTEKTRKPAPVAAPLIAAPSGRSPRLRLRRCRSWLSVAHKSRPLRLPRHLHNTRSRQSRNCLRPARRPALRWRACARCWSRQPTAQSRSRVGNRRPSRLSWKDRPRFRAVPSRRRSRRNNRAGPRRAPWRAPAGSDGASAGADSTRAAAFCGRLSDPSRRLSERSRSPAPARPRAPARARARRRTRSRDSASEAGRQTVLSRTVRGLRGSGAGRASVH